eukprot:SAG11_NODE_610_length_8221_cov_4.801650_10_plen_71_part_00
MLLCHAALYCPRSIKKSQSAATNTQLGRLKAIEEALSDMQDVARRAEEAMESGGVPGEYARYSMVEAQRR